MHTAQLQNARIYLDQQYLVEQDGLASGRRYRRDAVKNRDGQGGARGGSESGTASLQPPYSSLAIRTLPHRRCGSNQMAPHPADGEPSVDLDHGFEFAASDTVSRCHPFCCRSAADSATGDCGPDLWLLLAATRGALFLEPHPKAVAPARAGVLYDADQRYRAVR